MRHSIIPAVYLILKNSQGEYCLTRRFQTGFKDGYYSLPAGHLNGGESLTQAMKRESKEEVGIDIDIDDLKLVFVSNNLTSNPERVDFFFIAEKWSGEILNMEPDKCDEIRWVKASEIPDNTIPFVKTALLSYLDGSLNYSEYWG